MQTIIAAFDERATAQKAIERLLQSGFSHDAVHLQHGHDADLTASTEATDTHRSFFGAVENFFTHIFSSESEGQAGEYTEAVRRGSSVVVVDAASETELDKARLLLSEFGSVDIDERAAQWKSKGWAGYDANAAPYTGESPLVTGGVQAQQTQVQAVEGETIVPIVQEELVVGKRTVEGGALRVVKRVTETPVSQLVTLRQERATIDRRPVDRPATEADFTNFKEGTIEVREMSEEAVVGKTARVVEEVRVGKDVSERSETVSDAVRRTDVQVERVPGGTSSTSDIAATEVKAATSGSTIDKSLIKGH